MEWLKLIPVLRMFNFDENTRNPICPRCGQEFSIIQVPKETFDEILEINDELVVDDDKQTVYICSKCVPMNKI